ncbi:MAG: SUMF1/EgtB/PvdO family nonheme iron enzyme [Deltaproteobacteria bacterium]|nr:SUMF1/EgtB/PvdO family nonheme iron enzyme [Deltaproteobacteria bacterium]
MRRNIALALLLLLIIAAASAWVNAETFTGRAANGGGLDGAAEAAASGNTNSSGAGIGTTSFSSLPVNPSEENANGGADGETANVLSGPAAQEVNDVKIPENFVLIRGGSFQMGSPDSEAWRGTDETLHTVAVSDFRMSRHELTQTEYQAVMGDNPSSFSGADLPVENISWLDAIAYCNARSEKEGLTPAYSINGRAVTWERSANGYRLPTEAEWEYACRAGTTTPFNTENSISAKQANYYGHYPYRIEENYFSQGNLDTKPGEYRQATVAVGGFSPNGFGLYDMHGNVGEWVWDYYGDYDAQAQSSPTGPASGTLRIYRGGGWNDFAKNMRSAYRAAMAQDKGSFNIGVRLVLNAAPGAGSVTGSETKAKKGSGNGKILIAYFSWGGNTRGLAREIQEQTGADLFEIELVNPYSSNYNTVLNEAQRDQNAQLRPELANHVDNMRQYDTILIGYPNWWASIPMPIASFLEEYDFDHKMVIPFCSHGGGRFGQSLTAIAKLVPNADMGVALSVHYSGGGSLANDITAWLRQNDITAH